MAVRDATLTADECVVDAADWAATWVNGEATLMPVLKFGGTDMLSMASRAAISIVNKAFSLEVAKNFEKCHQNGNLVYYEAWKKAPLNNDQKDTLHQLFDRAVCLEPDAHAGLACSTTANWCIVAEHKRSNLLLTRADLAPLFLEGKWLGGELINYYLELLRDQTLASTGRPLAIFSSFFAKWLDDPVNNTNPNSRWYNAVNRIADQRSPSIQSIEGFVFPCNPGRSHWTVFFEDIVHRQDIYYDDLCGWPSGKIVHDLRGYVRQLAVSDEVAFLTDGRKVADYNHDETVPLIALGNRQKNGNDCGKYLLANCDAIIGGLNPLYYSACDLSAIVERIALEIMLQQSLRSCPLPWLHLTRVAERERVSSIAASIANFDHDKSVQEFAALPEERKHAFLFAKAKATHDSRFSRVLPGSSSLPTPRDLRRSARLEKRYGPPFVSLPSAEQRLRLAEAEGNSSFGAHISHDCDSFSSLSLCFSVSLSLSLSLSL